MNPSFLLALRYWVGSMPPTQHPNKTSLLGNDKMQDKVADIAVWISETKLDDFFYFGVFGLLSSSLLSYSQRIGRCVLRPSSGVSCWTREPTRTSNHVLYLIHGHPCFVSLPLPNSTSISTPIIHIMWKKKKKKRIVRCLQHRAKAISSNIDVYLEEMFRLRHNLYRNNNNNPESIILVPRNLDWTKENDSRRLIAVCLPYVNSRAERIQKICSPYYIRTIFTSGSTL